jgi:hypothetical protein
MKHLIKNIAKTLVAVPLLCSLTVKGADLSFPLHTAAASAPYATNIIDGGAQVDAIYIVNGAAIAVNYAIYDAPATNATRGPLQGFFPTYYSNGAYVSYSSYRTNLTKTITNFSGITTNLVASNVLWTYAVTNVAATNNYRLIAAGQIAASTTLTLPLESRIHLIYGLTITNSASTNSSVRVLYSPAL